LLADSCDYDGIVSVLLELQGLTVELPTPAGWVRPVNELSLHIAAGECLGLVGESGSGKTMLSLALMGLLPPGARVSGDALFHAGTQRNLAALADLEWQNVRGREIAMIFQEPMTSLNPVMRVGPQIEEAIRAHEPSVNSAAIHKNVLAALQQAAVPEPEQRAQQFPHQLSGGLRQRVMIAMALANRPDVLIADEPTTALDVTVQAQILKLIKDLQTRYGMAVILITHDLTIVRKVSDYVYVMQRGRVQEHNVTPALFAAPRHPYTQHLLASEPKGTGTPPPDNSPVILDGRKVRVTFGLTSGTFFKPELSELVAVDSLDINVRKHETLGLVGESGSGKTTFGQALLRLIANQGGEITFDGQRIEGFSRGQMQPLRSRMQIVFQDPFSSLNPRMSVGQIIEEGLQVNGLGRTRAERLVRVREALTSAGMPGDILGRFPHEFSGGQRQRIAIARAIALEPEFMLLDEPTSALDLSVQAQIIDLLRKLQAERGLSYLFISHDLKVVRALCHRVMVMQNGRVVEQGPVAQVLSNPQTDYTRRLVRAAFDVAA